MTGAPYKKWLAKLESGSLASAASFKGLPVMRGVAKGRVRIVMDLPSLLKVRRGDILVAVTTNPDYLPGIRRACAIITDEGGLTSHTAIVARELKIPCIVGAKIATRVLKDGDMVEVDAGRGVIKKMRFINAPNKKERVLNLIK